MGSTEPVAAGRILAVQHSKNQSGVFVSADLGATWTFSLSPDVRYGAPTLWADGSRLFVFDRTSSSANRLSWSDDGGATWQSKSLDFGTTANPSLLHAIAARGTTVVAKSLITQRPRPGGGGVEMFNDDVMAFSTDFGDTWQQGDPDSTILRSHYGRNPQNVPPPIGIVGTKGGFLYANVTRGTWGGRLYFSADGDTWEPTNVNGFARATGNIFPFGDALFAFENETMQGGAGFFRSDDGGHAWRYVTSLNYGSGQAEGCAQQYGRGLAVALADRIVAVCEADVYHSTDGLNFTKVGPDAVPTNRTQMLTESGGTLYLLSWSSSLGGYGGQNATLYTSTDAGLTWTQQADALRTLTRPSVGGPNVALTDRATAYFSTDGGATFSQTSTLFTSNISDVAATPTALFAGSGLERVLFGTVITRRTFYRSMDGGQSWQDLITDGIVADGPRSLHNDGTRLVATFTDSVAVSEDDGQTWHGLADGWPREAFTEHAFVFKNNVYVQVLNEGLYQAPLSALGIATSAEARDVPTSFALELWPNPAVDAVQMRFTLPHAQPIELVAHDLLGREVARLTDRVEAAGTHDVRWEMDDLAAGVYVVRLTTDDGRAETQTVVKL